MICFNINSKNNVIERKNFMELHLLSISFIELQIG